MGENDYKFYLCDRWFYFIGTHNDDNNIRKYASNIHKPYNGIIIEKNVIDNTLQILYYVKNKLYSKISVSDITQREKIVFRYTDIEPHLTSIKGNEYVNLRLIAFSCLKYGNLVKDNKVLIQKVKRLRSLCYREPDFPLDMTLSMIDLNISNSTIDYYLKLVSNFNFYSPDMIVGEPAIYDASNKEPKLGNLVIPSSYYLFDREYDFVRDDFGKLLFKNNEDVDTNLTINYDYMYHCINGFEINFKEYDRKTSRIKSNCNFTIQRHNEYGGVTISFYNKLKENIGINSQNIEEAKYRYVAKYDRLNNQVYDYLEVEAGRKKSMFHHHPNFSTTYVDPEGKIYRIGNQNFAKLYGMANYGLNAFDSMQKKLVK